MKTEQPGFCRSLTKSSRLIEWCSMQWRWNIGALLAGMLPLLALAAPSAAPFDYYVLSLSWAPEFCAEPGQAAANPQECQSGKAMRFVVHGLWPEANQGKNPESCGPAKAVPKAIVNSLLPYMPSPGLIQHEWATHGTCTGLTQDDYFTGILRLRAAVQTPVQIDEAGTESPGEIEEQFSGSNPGFPKDAFRVACRGIALTEVRVCFDKNLKARSCTASVGDCKSQAVTIRPPR